MKRRTITKTVLAMILAAVMLADFMIWAPPARAQVTPANAVVGLARVINAINRRTRVYQAARDTQKDFNGYYDSLQNTARSQLISGELNSLRRGEAGLQTVRAGAYIKLTAALAAEQEAITRAIDMETNQARRDFNRTLARQLQEVVIRLPGAQQILGEVRAVISNLRSTILAMQAAAASNQPLDVLTQRLAEQVSSSTIVQDRVRNLGSALGPDLDRALGGALTQVDNTIADVNREANQAVQLLDGMDAQVAELDLSQAESAENETAIGPVTIRLTDRATAVLDVASQALAVLSAMQGTGGTTREQMFQQIRTDLLNERNTDLLDAAQNVSQVACTGVGRGEYEVAIGMLGKAPETAADQDKATYMVCSDRDTGQPVRAWIVGVVMPTVMAVEDEIPFGTYVGGITPPTEFGGESIVEHRISVVVGDGGKVTGEMLVVAEDTSSPYADCSLFTRRESRAEISGHLSSASGTLNLVIHQRYWSSLSEGCASGHTALEEGEPYNFPYVVEVRVEGSRMTGFARDAAWPELTFTFEATRQ